MKNIANIVPMNTGSLPWRMARKHGEEEGLVPNLVMSTMRKEGGIPLSIPPPAPAPPSPVSTVAPASRSQPKSPFAFGRWTASEGSIVPGRDADVRGDGRARESARTAACNLHVCDLTWNEAHGSQIRGALT